MLDENKYYWALAEMIAAAGLLAQRTGAAKYWAWYDKCWAYAQVTPQRPPHTAPPLTCCGAGRRTSSTASAAAGTRW